MLLTIALGLSALGFVGIAVGAAFDMTGVAVIGAVIIVGVGATVTTQGLQYRDGQTVEKEFRNESGEFVNNESAVEATYREVETADQLSIGFLWMLLGGGPALHFISRAGDS
jgi:hypothetical protein